MDVTELLDKAKDTVTVKRVFGEPIEKDGVIVIPVAAIYGGGGGGSGGEGPTLGSGGGFGFHARPLGVYVISGGKVRFQPAVGVGTVLLGAFLFLRPFLKKRKKRARKRR
jgi:uncharacterized spore protein YtfJ